MNICSICTFNFRALPRQRLINFQSTLCWLLLLHYCVWIVVVYCNKSCSTETSWHPNMNIVFFGEYCRTMCTNNIHRDIITQHLNWLAPFGNNFRVVLLKISSLNSAEEWKVSGDNKVWENSQICKYQQSFPRGCSQRMGSTVKEADGWNLASSRLYYYQRNLHRKLN